MKNKKIIIPCGIVAVIAVLLIICFVFKGNSVSGTWVIDYYITDNGNIKQEDIGEYYGTDFQKMYDSFEVQFKSGNKAILIYHLHLVTRKKETVIMR